MSASETHRSLKRLLRNAATIILFSSVVSEVRAQASLSSTTYTQNFDAATAAALPTGWKVGAVDSYSGAATVSTVGTVGSSLASSLSSTNSGVVGLFKDSVADQAIGILNTGSVASPKSVYFAFTNNTGSTVTAFSLAWDYEKFRSGTRAFDWTLFGGTTNTVDTAITAGNKSYAADAANTTITMSNNELVSAATASVTGLTLAAGGTYYLEWKLTGVGGSTNGQALGIDNFSLTATLASVGGNYWVGGNGAWSSSSTSFATTSGGTTGATQATSNALVFDAGSGFSVSPAVTVNDTVTVNAGLTFDVDGVIISPDAGTPLMNFNGASAAANVVTVNSTYTSSISVKLTGSNGLTKSGSGKLVLSGDNSGLTGAVTLAAGTLRATAATALGAGTLSISGGTLELATNSGSFGRNTTISGDTTIKSDRAAISGVGLTQTLGTLAMGANILTIDKGVYVGSGTAGVTFSAVTLSGAPTFTVNTGSLLTLASVTGTAQNIIINGAGDTTVSGAIATTTGSLTKSGNGILTLNGANTFTGGLTLNAGTVSLGNTGALNSTAGFENTVTFGSGSTGTLSLNGNNATIAGLNTNATPGTTFVKNGSASNNATLTIGNSTNANSTFAGTIQNGSTGTLAINKAGTGTLTLTNANTYTGGTTLNAGTIKLSGSGALAGGTVAIGGGTLSVVNAAGVDSSGGALTGTSNSIAGNINLNSGIIDLTAGSLSVGGDLTLSGGNIKYTLGKTFAVTGQLNLSAPVNVTLDGSYTVGAIYTLLSYSNTSPSPDFVNNFKISLLNNSLGKWTYDTNGSSAGVYKITILSLASNLNWNLTDAGTWDTTTTANWYNSKNFTTQAFADGDNVTFDKSAGGIITINGTVTPGTTTVNSSGDYTFESGAIAGDGGITKSGNGKLTLSAANTFTGEVVVNAGTLVVGNVNALGAITTGTRILSGATLEISSDITLAAEPLTLVGTGVAGAGALTSQPGVHTVTGPITLSGDTLITSQGSAGPDTFTITGPISGSNYTLSVGGSASTVISGNISGTGLALNKTGNGILTLSGSGNTYGGLTSVNAGTLVAQSATSISPTVSVSNGATLSLQDNQTLTSLTGSGQVSVADGKTFTLNNATTQSFGGTFTGAMGTAFTKSGSGTLTLSGASTNLSSEVTVNAGTVKIANNSALGSGAVTINSGNIYAGSGKTVSNNITIGNVETGGVTATAAIQTWNFNGQTGTNVTQTANTVATGLDTGTVGSVTYNTLTRGTSATVSAGGNSFRTVGFQNNGIATSNTDYFQWIVSSSSQNLNLNSITARYNGTATYLASPGVSTQYAYSLDGTNFTLIGSAVVVTVKDTLTTYDLSTVTALQNLSAGTDVYFRFYSSGQTTTGGWGYSSANATADGLTMIGSLNTFTPAGGSGALGIDEAGTATFTGNVVVNNTAELTAATGGTAVFKTGVISGTGSLNKTGDGTVELQGANTFTGSLTLTAGNLKVSTLGAGGAASPLGAAADVPGSIIFTGGKLEYAGSGETLTRDFTIGNGGAGFIASGLGALNIGQGAKMDFDNATASNRTLSLGGTTDIAVENIFNPAKFDPAEINNLFTKLVKQDVNKWVVLGAGAGFVDNAATEVNINGGELDFEMGALGSKSTINVGTATLGWYNSSNADDLSGRINLNAEAASAFNIPPNNTLYFAKSFNGGGATSASLIKLGTGTLELGAANNFSGGLTVSAGTVKASFAGSVGTGAVSISSNATFVVNAILANKISVKSGGTLAGTGTDADATIEEDGILSPNADGIGTLSFNKLTLNGGAHVKWQLQNAAGAAGVGYDTLVVATLNLSNAISTKKKIIVEVTSSGKATGFDKTKVNQFEFAKLGAKLADGVNVTDLFSIDASQFEDANNLLNDHLVWSMQYAADRDMMYVTTMIPEPSTYGLGLSALALAAVAIRRRKKKKV